MAKSFKHFRSDWDDNDWTDENENLSKNEKMEQRRNQRRNKNQERMAQISDGDSNDDE